MRLVNRTNPFLANLKRVTSQGPLSQTTVNPLEAARDSYRLDNRVHNAAAPSGFQLRNAIELPRLTRCTLALGDYRRIVLLYGDTE